MQGGEELTEAVLVTVVEASGRGEAGTGTDQHAVGTGDPLGCLGQGRIADDVLRQVVVMAHAPTTARSADR